MPFQTLITDQAGGIFTITLNRPEKRNAITYEMIDELVRAFAEAEQSPVQVVIVTGMGQAFCAGMDLENLKGLIGRSPAQSLEDSQAMARLFRTIYEFPKPTIAAVNGAAMAGGAGIATLCDFTLASQAAKFGYTEVRIGFVPAIVSVFLIAQIGEKHARDLLLTGRIINVDEAYRLGLVNEIVPEDFVVNRALHLAKTLMDNSPTSLRATKKLLGFYIKEQLDRQIAEAVRENAAIRATADFKEGITAFLEKRKPKWQS